MVNSVPMLNLNLLNATNFKHTPFQCSALCLRCGKIHMTIFYEGIDDKWNGRIACVNCKVNSAVIMNGIVSTAN